MDALSGEVQTGAECTHSHTPHTHTLAYTHTGIHTHSLNPPTHSHTPYTQHTHTLTHSLKLTHTLNTHTYTYTHSHIHQTHTYTQHSLTQSHPTHTNHPHHSHTHTHSHTHSEACPRRGTGWQESQGRAGGRSLAPLRSVYLQQPAQALPASPLTPSSGSGGLPSVSPATNSATCRPACHPRWADSIYRCPLCATTPTSPLPSGPCTSHPGGSLSSSSPCRCPLCRPPHVPAAHRGPSPLSWGTPLSSSNQKCLWVLSSGMGAHGLSLSSLAQEHLVPCSGAPVAPSCFQPWTLSHSLLPSQNNLISKVPRGALSRQTHLREHLQHNQLTDSGLDATFQVGLNRVLGDVGSCWQ